MGGVVTIQGLQTGVPSGSVQIGPITLTPSNVTTTELVPITIGNNTVAVPANATFVLISFPVLTTSIAFKSVAGDSNTNVIASTPNNSPSLINVSAIASFVLNVAATMVSSFMTLQFF